MKVLVVGTGAVGAAVAAVAKQRDFFERITFADLDPARPAAVLARDGDERFAAAQVDAGDKDALVGLLRETEADAVLNAADPRFNPPTMLSTSFRPSNAPMTRKPFAYSRSTHRSMMSSGRKSNETMFLLRISERKRVFGAPACTRRTRSQGFSLR